MPKRPECHLRLSLSEETTNMYILEFIRIMDMIFIVETHLN